MTGADPSEAMLAHACTHPPPGPRYVRADLHRFDLGPKRFDAGRARTVPAVSPHQRPARRLPRPRRRAPAPGGLLVAEMQRRTSSAAPPDLLDTPAVHAFTWQGTAYRPPPRSPWTARLQLLRRTRVDLDDEAEPVVQRSRAWRLPFPAGGCGICRPRTDSTSWNSPRRAGPAHRPPRRGGPVARYGGRRRPAARRVARLAAPR
ncbi:class I SAM-dependent methyltransferase [Streptomyces tricolor]|nr:class I SAM-dependent methyltransferase [Streptomyces tricolor]